MKSNTIKVTFFYSEKQQKAIEVTEMFFGRRSRNFIDEKPYTEMMTGNRTHFSNWDDAIVVKMVDVPINQKWLEELKEEHPDYSKLNITHKKL